MKPDSLMSAPASPAHPNLGKAKPCQCIPYPRPRPLPPLRHASRGTQSATGTQGTAGLQMSTPYSDPQDL